MKKQRMEKLGNALVVVLALSFVAAYAVDMANRTEHRLQSRAIRSAK